MLFIHQLTWEGKKNETFFIYNLMVLNKLILNFKAILTKKFKIILFCFICSDLLEK